MRTGLLTALESPSLNLNHSGLVWLDTAPTPPACKHEANQVQTRISIQSHSVEVMVPFYAFIGAKQASVSSTRNHVCLKCYNNHYTPSFSVTIVAECIVHQTAHCHFSNNS